MLTLVLATLLADPKLVVGVVSNAADTAKFAASADFTKLTHVVVAYENPVDDTGTLSFNPADEALVARAKAADVRVLVALGGPAAKDPALAARYADLMSEPKRRGFMRKVNGYLKAHNFQGVDLELDGSVIGKEFGAFVDALGNGLFNQGWLYGVTLSKATMPEDVPATAFANCDFVAAMPEGDASAEAAKASVAYWVGRGIPKTKLLLGIPFRALGSGTPYAEIVAKYPRRGDEGLRGRHPVVQRPADGAGEGEARAGRRPRGGHAVDPGRRRDGRQVPAVRAGDRPEALTAGRAVGR